MEASSSLASRTAPWRTEKASPRARSARAVSVTIPSTISGGPSIFQVHLGSGEVLHAGDVADVLVEVHHGLAQAVDDGLPLPGDARTGEELRLGVSLGVPVLVRPTLALLLVPRLTACLSVNQELYRTFDSYNDFIGGS